VVSEQEELAAASRVRGPRFWVGVIAIGVVFIAACVYAALAPQQYAVHYRGTNYGNCVPSSDTSFVSCTALEDSDGQSAPTVRIGEVVYDNCQGVGEPRTVHALWMKKVVYDSIVCYKADAS